MRLMQETYHDRQGEEALPCLYESDGDGYALHALIGHRTPAANNAGARDTVYYIYSDV